MHIALQKLNCILTLITYLFTTLYSHDCKTVVTKPSYAVFMSVLQVYLLVSLTAINVATNILIGFS